MKKILFLTLFLAVLSCKKNEPPIVIINTPEANEIILLGDPINISTSVEDLDGIISEVRVLINDIGIVSLTAWPYNYTISSDNYEPGEYEIKVIALDDDGAESTANTSIKIGTIADVYTDSVLDIGTVYALVGGFYTKGSEEVTEKGVYWSKLTNPESTGEKFSISDNSANFSDTLKGLDYSTKYYIKAYAVNDIGASLGTETSFTTLTPTLPKVTTIEISEVSGESARISGIINSDGGIPIIERGLYWDTIPTPELNGNKVKSGDGIGEFNVIVNNLKKGTLYYVRLYAENEIGTAFGEIKSFSTNDIPSLLTTCEITPGSTIAKIGGSIITNGGSEVIERGVYFSKSPDPALGGTKTTIDTDNDIFSITKNNLEYNNVYYAVSYAINDVGEGLGNSIEFLVSDVTGFISDIDGNSYKTVLIGDQWWMAANLSVTRFNDGSSLIKEESFSSWLENENPAYCWFNNDEITNRNPYGAMYNAYAIESNKNICPSGWHIPSDDEWKILESILGMPDNELDNLGYRGTLEGGKLKETGTTHWKTPNTAASDEFGFSAIPGGMRSPNNDFVSFGNAGFYWTSSTNELGDFYRRLLYYEESRIHRSTSPHNTGLSIRCVKD